MAGLQRLQDEYSQFFLVSIRVLDREELKSLTVESNGHTRCVANRETSSDICERFIRRAIDRGSDRFTVSMCPFGLTCAIAPLGKPMGAGAYERPKYFLLAVDNPLQRRAGGGAQGGDIIASIVDGDALHNKAEFEKKVSLIVSSFDLIFAMISGLERGDGPETATTDPKMLDKLTKREREVMRLVCIGMSNQQVAEELYISEHTVKLHVSSILRKLDLTNRTQLAVYGIQML